MDRFRRQRAGVFLLCLAAPLACKRASSSQLKEFVNDGGNASQGRATDFTLAHAGISHQASVVEFNPGLVSSQTHLEFRFGRLTQTSFEQLRETYGGEASVPYDPERSYELVDFLPRMIQATLKHRFNVQRLAEASDADPREYGRFLTKGVVASNCWGTAYEFARQRQTPESTKLTVFYVRGERIVDFFLSETYSSPVKKLDEAAFRASREERNVDLQLGDVLIVLRQSYPPRISNSTLVHAAVFIDDDLVYEKFGADDVHYYRLATLADVAREYPPEDHFFLVRRFDKAPIPPPKEQFSRAGTSSVDQSTLLATDVELVVDPATGRYRLSDAAYQAQTFERL